MRMRRVKLDKGKSRIRADKMSPKAPLVLRKELLTRGRAVGRQTSQMMRSR